MDFELDDEQEALRDVSRDVLGRYAGPEAARRLVGGGADPDPALWTAGAEIGWLALAVPEAKDGLGRGLVELSIVAEELGRALAAGPFSESALIARLLADADSSLADELLPPLTSGKAAAVWAVAEPGGSFSPEAVHTTARREGDAILLDGMKTAVEAAVEADWLLVTADEGGSPVSYLVRRDAPGVRIERERVIDETRPRYRVGLEAVAAAGRVAGPDKTRAFADAAALLTAADALGAAEVLLGTTVEYVKVRRQFDRAIGSFQAVKHALADMLRLVRGARAAVSYAAMAADAHAREAALAAAVAKSYSSAGLSRVAGLALQLHGGIGFTWEHDLHLYLRRIKADEILHGDSTVHSGRVLALRGA